MIQVFLRMRVIFKRGLCLSLFLYSMLSFAQDTELVLDTADVTIITFDEALIDEILSIKDFNYDNDPKYDQNILRRYWNLLLRRIFDYLGQDAVNVGWSILKYALIFLGIGLLVYYLMRLQRTVVFRKEDKIIMPDEATLIRSEKGAQSIHRLMVESESKNDFRNAIRYRFLEVLRNLNALELIKWRDFKTNKDYVLEISEPDLGRELGQLSHIFEDIYYGAYELNEEKYNRYKVMFENFSGILKSRER